jgi:hypothetical protein
MLRAAARNILLQQYLPIGDILTILGHPIGDHLRGTYVPVEEPSTASKAD